MQNINYNLEMEKTIKNMKEGSTLLLHSCCGPCSSAVLERLSEHFKITVYFYNPNMDSKEEFYRRVEEQKKLINEMEVKNKIDLVVEEFDSNEFYSEIKGYEKEEEGGKRCRICYELRLKKSAEYASKNNFDYFTTTLSISPHKNSQVLNEIGSIVANDFEVEYLYSDFKKKNGYKRSVELSKEYNMYRQDYCGCIYSKVESEKRNTKD